MSETERPLRATQPPARQGLPRPAIQRPPRFDVVLFGDKYLNWAPTLPQDPVWARLPRIASVTHQGDGWRPATDRPTETNRLVLPLDRWNILATPFNSWSLLPKLPALTAFADKQQFSDFVAARGLGEFAPRTYAPGAEVFPLVLKRTNLAASRGVVLVRSPGELEQRLGEPVFAGQPVVRQEYIEAAADHVTHAVCLDGRFAWHCTYTYRTGPGALATPRDMVPIPDQLSDQDRDVLNRFTLAAAFTGPVNIDYRRRADGRLAILEINPRFGGSLLRRRDRSDLLGALQAIVANARWYGSPPPR